MTKTFNGQLVPIKIPENGRWVSTETAAKLFKNGKGITHKRMMNRIYEGKHNGFVKKDHLGNWWVFIPDFNFPTTTTLRAA